PVGDETVDGVPEDLLAVFGPDFPVVRQPDSEADKLAGKERQAAFQPVCRGDFFQRRQSSLGQSETDVEELTFFQVACLWQGAREMFFDPRQAGFDVFKVRTAVWMQYSPKKVIGREVGEAGNR